MKCVDLTHAFTTEMPSYPGDPKPELVQTASVEKDGYTDHKLTTQMHVGTHMDAPLHMIPGGKTLDRIPLTQFFGPGVLLDARGKSSVDVDLATNVSIPNGAIVLVYTGFEDKWKTDAYMTGYPSITQAFAKRMVSLRVHLLGMDMLGPDEPPFPTHKILLGNGILIIENLTNLKMLLGKKFDVIALPVKLATDAAPVRVIAEIHP